MDSIPRKGVFLPSASLDSELIIDCLRALHIDYPSVKFTSICSDEKLGGFKVCFSDLDEAVVLKRKQLMMFDKKISIYPLTANLLVNGIPSRKTPLYERDVRDAILRKFGRVLSVKIESSNEWLVEIEVPEFKNLQVFERHIHSELTVDLPNRNETLKLKFWCGHCGKSGHFRHECTVLTPVTSREASGSGSLPGENLQKKLESKSKTADSNQPINGRTNLSLEPTNVFAEKIGREEIMKGTWSNGNKKQDNAATAYASSTTSTENNGLLTEKDIKKESEALGAQRSAKDEKYSKTVNSTIPKMKEQQSIRDESCSRGTVDSDSNNDDEILFLEESSKTKSSTNLTTPDSNSTFTVGRGNTTDSSTSRISDLPSGSSSSGTPVPSSETYSSPLRPAKGAEVTTILSERLQESINEACSSVGVLERQKLDAFLIHVKKKSNPIRVALNYTQNAKGLKEQLKQILFIYYNTPQTGTKEDIQFIKWLNGLVERFDGSIPRKRKRAGQSNDDEPPIRKIK